MTAFPRSDSIEFAAHPAVAACARRRTRLALRAWNLEELADEAEQVVTELIVNSVEAHRREHLAAPVRLTLLAGLRTVLIAVRDASDGAPLPRAAAPGDEDGRGLLIVDALCAKWNVKTAPGGGKTVRCLLTGRR